MYMSSTVLELSENSQEASKAEWLVYLAFNCLDLISVLRATIPANGNIFKQEDSERSTPPSSQVYVF